MKVKLSDAQIQVLKSMNMYWEEIAGRENAHSLSDSELHQLYSVLNPMQVLLICGEYAKTYKSPLKQPI